MLAAPGARADEPIAAPMGSAERIAALEPVSQQQELAYPASLRLKLAPLESAQPQESALGIDLQQVKDLASIVDEARKQAQVDYLAEKLRQPAQTLRQYVELAWDEASRRVGLSPELLIAVMHKESVFRPKVRSPYGAQGLMQVVRRWHSEKLHASESLYDPVVNVRVGTDILEEYLESAEGNLPKALAKYSGNANGYAKTVINESQKLERIADQAAAQVATAPRFFEAPSAEDAG